MFGIAFNVSACTPDNETPLTDPKPTEQPKNPQDNQNPNQPENMNIKIIIDDKIVTATLNDTPTSQDFIAKLPLTLQMSRHEDREYYAAISLSKKASIQNGYAVGDISYWTPGNCIVFYYAQGYTGSLIKMGKITSDLSIFNSLDSNIAVRIEKEN
jgi:hypothetical protein